MGWLFLLGAGIAEIVFALSLKFNCAFTKLWPSVVTVISSICSFYLLMLSIRSLPLGTAYAVWTGMGAVGVAVIGILWLNESTDLQRLLSILLIVAGIIGLRLSPVD
jgi:quaternary ammonium compound-resistance protein SugE